tara:strand:+ start:810 stop:950 length:141 start_codon:yes stop_codon:yes gene_type:complete
MIKESCEMSHQINQTTIRVIVEHLMLSSFFIVVRAFPLMLLLAIAF